MSGGRLETTDRVRIPTMWPTSIGRVAHLIRNTQVGKKQQSHNCFITLAFDAAESHATEQL